jgi:type II secretory pathway component GspD/PulD (secretin)
MLRLITILLTLLTFSAISTAQEVLPPISNIINKSDVTTKMPIIYEAHFIEISANDIKSIGIDWGTNNSINDTIISGKQLPFGGVGRIPHNWNDSLTSLIQSKKAHLLASPNLSALEGVEATAFIGQQFKYIIGSQHTPQGTTIQTESMSVGITLKVKGESRGDGSITMFVHPEVSTVTGYLSAGLVNIPQISTRFVDATIRMKDGETIAIGGLMQRSDIETMRRVPSRDRLPIIKESTTNKGRTSKDDSQIIVFITAKTQKD